MFVSLQREIVKTFLCNLKMKVVWISILLLIELANLFAQERIFGEEEVVFSLFSFFCYETLSKPLLSDYKHLNIYTSLLELKYSSLDYCENEKIVLKDLVETAFEKTILSS